MFYKISVIVNMTFIFFPHMQTCINRRIKVVVFFQFGKIAVVQKKKKSYIFALS